MKIAIFSDTFPPEINGVSTSTKSLVDILKANHNEVLTVTTNPYSDKLSYDHNENLVRIPGLKLRSLYDYRMVNPLAIPLVKKVVKVVKDFKPDVMHVQTEWGVCIIGQRIAFQYGIPLVYTYHTMYEEYAYYVTGEHFNRATRAILRWYSKRMIHKCLEFIAPSIKTKDYMRSIGISNYINVVPTGIDFTSFKRNDDDKLAHQLKKELKITPSTKVFLLIGRVAPEKSIDVVIKGYANFKKAYPKIKTVLLVVGGGPALPELIALSERLDLKDTIRFIGPVSRDKVHLYYKISDIFLSASLTETQGLTYVEAMASSLIPIVRFDNNLINLIIDNETGFFFHNEDDFVSIVYRALNLKEEEINRMLKKGQVLIENYSIDKFYTRIIKVYERAIQKNW